MEYITKEYLENQGFYQLNRNLFNNNAYRRKITKLKTIKNKKIEVTTIVEVLSDTSKILYTILLNQYNRSLKNGWFDSEGRVYVKFSVDKLAQYMGKSKDTIIKYKKELEKNELLKIVSGKNYHSDFIFLGKIKEISSEIEMENINLIDFTPPDAIMENLEQKHSTISPISFDTVLLDAVDNVDSIKLTNKIYTKTTNNDIPVFSLKELIEKFPLKKQ